MYNKDNMKGAKSELNQFLAMADDMKGLPPQSGIAAGNYDLGYIYLKEENYVESLKYFEKAIAGFKNVRSTEDPFVGSRLLPDATLRAGDSHLKKNNYAKAKEYYEKAEVSCREINNPEYLANTLNNLSSIYNKIGDNKKGDTPA